MSLVASCRYLRPWTPKICQRVKQYYAYGERECKKRMMLTTPICDATECVVTTEKAKARTNWRKKWLLKKIKKCLIDNNWIAESNRVEF